LDSDLAGPSTELLGILAGILGGAILASVDAALGAFGRARARRAAEGTGPHAKTATRYLDRGSAIHKRLLTGRVVCQAVVVILAHEAARELGGGWLRSAAWISITALLYALAVATSSHFAARRASRLALPLLYWTRPLELVMAPLATPLVWTGSLLDRLYPPKPEDTPERITELDVDKIIEQAMKTGSIKRDRARLLRSVIEFHATVAREIMVPRTSMVAIEVSTSLKEVVKLITDERHSRYPVYRETIDQVVGILYAKDIFQRMENGGLSGTLADLVRTPPFFAAETQKISELLRLMQARRMHLAIVADEYGGTSGMVTLEDIIEEIVGEIRDEHDIEEPAIQKVGPGRYLVRADTSAYDVAETTGLTLPPDAGNYDSLGGLIIGSVGRVPSKGESISVGSHDVTVREADERHVIRVEVAERKEVIPAAE